jgi:hypothetical protein
VNWNPQPGQLLVFATKHHKRAYLGPVFRSRWGLRLVTPLIDTDLLGTFTGERIRAGDVATTLRAKISMALEAEPNADLIVATEGSFGPDPVLGWVPLHEEVLLWSWPQRGKELWVSHRSHDTNFSSTDEAKWPDVRRWAERIGFPSAQVIVRDACGAVVAKGLGDWSELEHRWHTASKGGVPSVETDMRADRNPKRQTVLRLLAQKTVAAMRSCCPKCEFPGFVAQPALPGASCAECGSATRLPRELKAECVECGHCDVQPSEYERNGVDPGQCDRCNP